MASQDNYKICSRDAFRIFLSRQHIQHPWKDP